MFMMWKKSAVTEAPHTTVGRRAFAAMGLAAALSGCATFDHSMVDMAVAHNQTLDRVERDVALLNLLRAADGQPLMFTTLSYVSGNASIGAFAGTSESRLSYFGPLAGSVSSNLGLNASRGYSFSLGPLDNEQFMRAFLADMTLDKLLYLVEGTSLAPEVIWTLAAYSLTFQADDGKRRVFISEPPAAEWNQFQAVLARALRQGLSMEEIPQEVPVGPRLSRDEALIQMGTVVSAWNGPMSGSAAGSAARPMLVESSDGDPAKRHQLVMVSNKVSICVDPPDLQSWSGDAARLCKSRGTQKAYEAMRSGAPRQPAPGAKEQPLLWTAVGLRSPREIYYLLGRIVQTQLERPGEPLLVGNAAERPGHQPKPLISVVCDTAPQIADTLAQVQYRGRVCHVPRDDGSHSAQVLQVLSLLVTLSKVQGAVPIAPTVLVR
jgi:hypothetical protein